MIFSQPGKPGSEGFSQSLGKGCGFFISIQSDERKHSQLLLVRHTWRCGSAVDPLVNSRIYKNCCDNGEQKQRERKSLPILAEAEKVVGLCFSFSWFIEFAVQSFDNVGRRPKAILRIAG